MRTLAIFGRDGVPAAARNAACERLTIAGVPVTCAMLDVPAPRFPDARELGSRVLLKTLAFSCNYRDKGLIVQAANKSLNNGYYVVGSEFCAEVLAIGEQVRSLAPGDRVVGNNAFDGFQFVPLQEIGIPTNHASREYQVLPAKQLTRVPERVAAVEAAAIGITGQTVFSMLRRIGASPHDTILVTALRSNTSLYAAGALAALGCRVYGMTTSNWPSEDLARVPGLCGLLSPDGATIAITGAGREFGVPNEFDCVIDPFFDIYLGRTVRLVKRGGRYVSCGMFHQVGERPPARWLPVIEEAIRKNLTLIWNCLGIAPDLEEALAACADRRIPILIDKCVRGTAPGEFLRSSFESDRRTGKVVYSYLD